MNTQEKIQEYERQVREAAVTCGFSQNAANCLHVVMTGDRRYKINIFKANEQDSLELKTWLEAGLQAAGYKPNYRVMEVQS